MRIEINIKVFEDDNKKPNTKMIETTEAFSIKPEMPADETLLNNVISLANYRIVETVLSVLYKLEKEIGKITQAERVMSKL